MGNTMFAARRSLAAARIAPSTSALPSRSASAPPPPKDRRWGSDGSRSVAVGAPFAAIQARVDVPPRRGRRVRCGSPPGRPRGAPERRIDDQLHLVGRQRPRRAVQRGAERRGRRGRRGRDVVLPRADGAGAVRVARHGAELARDRDNVRQQRDDAAERRARHVLAVALVHPAGLCEALGVRVQRVDVHRRRAVHSLVVAVDVAADRHARRSSAPAAHGDAVRVAGRHAAAAAAPLL